MTKPSGSLWPPYRWHLALWLTAVLSACSKEPPPAAPETPQTTQVVAATHIGSNRCGQCHKKQYDTWRDSHHDLAMQEATVATVVGNFDDSSFRYGDVVSTFSQRDDRFFVRTDGPQGELVEYPIAYTFGVEPLQQYLIEFADGRLQALNVVWDTRPAESGGQRWFHLYPDEIIDHRDILHWTRPLQNWNFMCAECHSTRVEKNYQPADDSFATSWKEIDVACEACHGPGSNHLVWAADGLRDPAGDTGLVSLGATDTAQWVMNPDTGIAQRSQTRTSHSEIETCARCHSRRSIFSEDYTHGGPLMNSHRPALLTEGLYYADGQILEEVYVYGSFLQSAMHRAGVSCSDCHEPHSLELRAPGNAVCARCHLPSVFDTTAHHRHEKTSTGSECVNCHMPSRNYMVVDARRDHSFRIPRPDLTVEIGTPNACNGCHADKEAAWAAQTVATWFGTERADATHYGEVLHAGRRGLPGAGAQLIKLAGNPDVPAIVRATAVTLLASNPHPAAATTLQRAAGAADPLLRMAAADAAPILAPPADVQLLGPLLSDPIRAVRLQAASNLLFTPADSLPSEFRQPFDAAIAEYREAQLLNADRAESHLNLGAMAVAERDLAKAVEEYNRAIEILPEFAAAYVNMADLYREGGREDAVETILQRGLAASPDAAALHHALGLSLIRRERYEEAIDSLRRAHELAIDNTRYAYVLGIALHSRGETTASLQALRDAHNRRPGDRDLLVALTTISRDAGENAQAIEYANALLDMDLGDPLARQILQELSR